MCLHGSYICLNRIPRNWRHQQNGNRSLRAVRSPVEACSNCAIHTTERRFSAGAAPRTDALEMESSVLAPQNWHPGVLDFYRISSAHRSDSILAPFQSVQSWCLLTMIPPGLLVSWGTCSHQVPGPENIQKACTFVEKVLAHHACNKSQTAHLYIQYSGLVYLTWYLPNLGLLG